MLYYSQSLWSNQTASKSWVKTTSLKLNGLSCTHTHTHTQTHTHIHLTKVAFSFLLKHPNQPAIELSQTRSFPINKLYLSITARQTDKPVFEFWKCRAIYNSSYFLNSLKTGFWLHSLTSLSTPYFWIIHYWSPFQIIDVFQF